jgi:hypothetical protein
MQRYGVVSGRQPMHAAAARRHRTRAASPPVQTSRRAIHFGEPATRAGKVHTQLTRCRCGACISYHRTLEKKKKKTFVARRSRGPGGRDPGRRPAPHREATLDDGTPHHTRALSWCACCPLRAPRGHMRMCA